MNGTAVAISVGLCVAIAVFEGILGTEGIRIWYPTLKKPRWHLPLPLFIAIGIAVYLIDGFVAYRLIALPLPPGSRIIGMTSLVVVMVFNALWNYAFFESRSVLVGLLLLLAFLAPLLILQVALTVYDRTAAAVHAIYFLFVIAYDVPLYYAIWRMNR